MPFFETAATTGGGAMLTVVNYVSDPWSETPSESSSYWWANDPLETKTRARFQLLQAKFLGLSDNFWLDWGSSVEKANQFEID